MHERSNTNYPMQHMNRFRSLVSTLGLMDLPLQGRRFTWSNGRDIPTYVRLDRFLMSSEWSASYPNTVQRAVTVTTSDHCPLVCTSQTRFPTANVFRIENAWLRIDQFKDMVRAAWAETPTATSVKELSDKIGNLTKQITIWKKEFKRRSSYQQKFCIQCLTWLTAQGEYRQLTPVEKVLQGVLQERHNQIMLAVEDKYGFRGQKIIGCKREIEIRGTSIKWHQ